MTSDRPLVTVITPVRNEAALLRQVIESVLEQRAIDFDLEILAVEGRSTDRSAEILATLASGDHRVRVLDNPHKLTPYARNIGLRAAAGEYVAMLDAHTVYAPNYLEACLHGLRRDGVVGCGGRVVVTPANTSMQAQLVAWTVGAPFVSSRKSMRTLQEGYVDTLPYPVFDKRAVLAAGGYDERLVRNQDNDLAIRLIGLGHRLYLTPKTVSYYHPQPTLRKLLRYAFRAGFWNGATVRIKRHVMRPRHLLPGVFVGTLLGPPLVAAALSLMGRGRRSTRWLVVPTIVLGAHQAAGLATAVQIAVRSRRPAALLFPAPALSFHVSYGMGVLVGLCSGPLTAGNGQSDAFASPIAPPNQDPGRATD